MDDVRWIRPFYLYPQQVTDELLDSIPGEARITKYLDMPLQHISDGMLKRMHRLGDRKHLTTLVERIRAKIPGVFFERRFIVGFPGETDAHFEELKQFVLDMEFDRVAVFLYSDEEGTSAVNLDRKVDQAVMEERRNELLALQESISESKTVTSAAPSTCWWMGCLRNRIGCWKPGIRVWRLRSTAWCIVNAGCCRATSFRLR